MSDDTNHAGAKDYGPRRILDGLLAQAPTQQGLPLPARVRLSEITQLPALFQPRNEKLDEHHVQALLRSLRWGGDLEPITVMAWGAQYLLVDGHHRLAAYALHGESGATIPVVGYPGTLEKAVLAAGKANSRAKLPMSNSDKQNYAWRLVKMGGYSKRQMVIAAGVSDGQIAVMRRVLSSLGADAYYHDAWHSARAAWSGNETEVDLEQWLDEQAADYADRMAKEFGSKLSNNTTIAAKAFAIYFGRKLPELAESIGMHLPEDEQAEGSDDEF